MSKLFQLLLFPFALLYDLVTSIRNKFFDLGVKKITHFADTRVVSIGNLTVGGTGKTPITEYLIQYISDQGLNPAAVLSRGYGRQTKGFRKAQDNSLPEEIGDEPFQIFRKYSELIDVYVGEKRVPAISQMLDLRKYSVIILDDAYQHRYAGRNLNVLLSDFNRPFYTDFVLPLGRLRERRAGAKRADAVIVTKCPAQLSDHDQRNIQQAIYRYTSQQVPVFFSRVDYGRAEQFFGGISNQDLNVGDKIVIVTGIAQHAPFVRYLGSRYQVVEQIHFPDHHKYTSKDVEHIRGRLKNGLKDIKMVTTEKDMVKMASLDWKDLSIFYVPIRISFLNENLFHSFLHQKLVLN